LAEGAAVRYLFEDYALDTGRRELRRGTRLICLTPQAFDLLDLLIRNRYRVVSKDDIFAAIWRGRIVSEAALTTRINAARSAVGDSGKQQRVIRTLPRKGFRFVGTVREEDDPEHRSAGDVSRHEAGIRPPERPSITVLPFANLSDDRELAFFAGGVVEDILIELHRLRWLLVTAGNSSIFDADNRAGAVADPRGARYVLDGSLRRMEGRVRVSARLADAATGMQVWAGRFERNLADLFSVQDELAETVGSAVASAIVKTEQRRAASKPPRDLGAWESYQRGMWHMSKCEASENAVAGTFFQRAIDLDPTYSSAHGALAWSHMMAASIFSEMTIAEGCALSEPLLRKAVALDDEDVEVRARLALASLLQGKLEDAMQEADQILSVSKNCAGALGVKGAAQVYSGNRDEGRRALLQYLHLSPRDPARPIRLSQIATALYLDGNYQEAAATARQVVRQYPQHPIAYRWLAASLGKLNRVDEARSALQSLQTISPSSFDMYVRQRPKYCSVEYAPMLDGLRKAGWRE
jgi:TolB-like protein/Flp pilus assembly protein TadD